MLIFWVLRVPEKRTFMSNLSVFTYLKMLTIYGSISKNILLLFLGLVHPFIFIHRCSCELFQKDNKYLPPRIFLSLKIAKIHFLSHFSIKKYNFNLKSNCYLLFFRCIHIEFMELKSFF